MIYHQEIFVEDICEYHIILYEKGDISISFQTDHFSFCFHKHFGYDKKIEEWLKKIIFRNIEFLLEVQVEEEEDYEMLDFSDVDVLEEFINLKNLKKEKKWEIFLYEDCQPIFQMIEFYVESKKREENFLFLLFYGIAFLISYPFLFMFLKSIS